MAHPRLLLIVGVTVAVAVVGYIPRVVILHVSLGYPSNCGAGRTARGKMSWSSTAFLRCCYSQFHAVFQRL
jgi:hypothetical protein